MNRNFDDLLCLLNFIDRHLTGIKVDPGTPVFKVRLFGQVFFVLIVIKLTFLGKKLFHGSIRLPK